MSIFNTKDHGWRDSYNPLRGLSMARLVSLLDAGERGQYADLQWFYRYMEMSDAVITSVFQRRRAALLSVDWAIRRVAGDDSDSPLANEQVDLLKHVYDNIENFRDAVGFLVSGVFRGYAHLEKHWDDDGLIRRLEPVEQWFWVRDGMFGDWEYNQSATSGQMQGEEIDPDDFIIFETWALDRILSLLYFRKNLGQRDWDSYLSVFGIPSVFLVGPENATDDQEKQFQTIADEIISDGRGFLPYGTSVEYVSPETGTAPFQNQIEYIDKQLTIAATGGLLTVLTEPGSGTLAGNAHSETFMQIARADAVMLSGLLQRSIDLPLLESFFPGQPVLAYFEFTPVASDQSKQVVKDVVDLSKAGLEVDPSEVAEKTGYTLGESDGDV